MSNDLQQLREQFAAMMTANRAAQLNPRGGDSYTLAEIAEVRLPLIDLELAELEAQSPAIREQRQQTSAELAAAVKAFDAAQTHLLASGERNKNAWLTEVNHEQTVQQLTKERTDLSAEITARRRGVRRVV